MMISIGTIVFYSNNKWHNLNQGLFTTVNKTHFLLRYKTRSGVTAGTEKQWSADIQYLINYLFVYIHIIIFECGVREHDINLE